MARNLVSRLARTSTSSEVDADSRAELKFNVTLSSGRSQVMESSDPRITRRRNCLLRHKGTPTSQERKISLFASAFELQASPVASADGRWFWRDEGARSPASETSCEADKQTSVLAKAWLSKRFPVLLKPAARAEADLLPGQV